MRETSQGHCRGCVHDEGLYSRVYFRWTNSARERQTDRQRERQTETETETERQTDRQTDRQTETEIETYKQEVKPRYPIMLQSLSILNIDTTKGSKSRN